MSLFGNLISKFQDINPISNLSWADRLNAAGSALQGQNGLDALRQLAQSRADQKRIDTARSGLLSDIEAAYTPQYPVAQSIDPALAGSPDHLPQPEAPDPREMIARAVLKARAQGLDIGNVKDVVDPPSMYDVINGGDGAYGIVNRRTGDVNAGQLPNQYTDLIRQLKEAQVAAANALATQRGSAAALNSVKTKAGGFAPKQPRAGRQTLPPLPPGFVVSQ